MKKQNRELKEIKAQKHIKGLDTTHKTIFYVIYFLQG